MTPVANRARREYRAQPIYGISALRAKRHEIDGLIVGLKRDLAKYQADIKRIDAALFILDPTYNAAAIPRRKTRKRVRLFEDGELGRLIIVALRKSAVPPTTHELAVTIASQRNIAHSVLITRRIRSNLAYLEAQGRVRKIGEGFTATWAMQKR